MFERSILISIASLCFIHVSLVNTCFGADANGIPCMTDSLDRASCPEPADKSAVTAAPAPLLSWTPGVNAQAHDVYLGTDFNDVNEADRAGPLSIRLSQQDSNSYDLTGRLDLNQTYYWRVDEVNALLNPSICRGDVWSFSTLAYVIVDDFESYKNSSPDKLCQKWIDGQGFPADAFFPQGHPGNGTGSMVGYDPNTGSTTGTTVSHSGKQSMSIFYNNTGTSSVSEVTRTFEESPDWTAFGAKTLVLFFRGAPGNAGQLYVKIDNTKITYGADSSAIARPFWTQWNIDLSSMVSPRGGLAVSALAVGIAGGSSGIVYIDDIRLYRDAPVPTDKAIQLDDLADHQVLQRTIGASQGAVKVSGTFSRSDVTRIRAQVVDFTTGNTIVTWQEIPVDLTTCHFSGTITVPQGYWYRLVAHALSSTGDDVGWKNGTYSWGVGINILCIGQSNMVGDGDIHTYHTLDSDMAGLYSNDRKWKKFADPYDGGGLTTDIDYDSWIGVSMIPYLLNSLARTFPGVPIGIVPAAKGSTPLHGTDKLCWLYRDQANHFNSDNLYGNSIAKARTVGGVELIIMHQGETDATNSVSTDQYIADLKTLLAHYREDLYPSVPLFICQLARSFTLISDKHRTDTSMQAIRAAQLLSDDPPNIYLAASCIDVSVRAQLNDDHYYQDGYDTTGARIGNCIAYYYGKSSFYRGPSIASATLSADRKSIDVSISHRGGNDLTPSSGITGFLALSPTGATLTIASAVKIDAAKLRINLSAAAPSGPISLQYLYGKAPTITGAVHDNSSLQLPLEPTAVPIVVAEQ